MDGDPAAYDVPLDHLRSLYFRHALGSGFLVPTPHAPAAITAESSSPDAGATPSNRRVRAASNSSRISHPQPSAFWTQHSANAHPDSHVSLHSRASMPQPGIARSQSPSLSYVHASPGLPIGLGMGQVYPSAMGYLPTRVLPVGEKKRILVTGGAGFVGSHLVDRLMLLGHEVLVLDNFFTGQKNNVAHWSGHPNFEMIRHDVVNPLHVEIDQIYHLACPASPISYQANQIKTIKTNFMGTLNQLGLAKRTKARFLLASTSEVYGDPDVHPQPETYNGNVNPTGPRACYDEGKRVAETLTYGYYYQDRVDVRVARIFNTFGPRMHPHDGRVVSNFILQALRGEPLTVFGDGSQTRSFMFIHDLIDGLIALMNVTLPKDDTSAPSRPPTPPSLTTKIMTEAHDSIAPAAPSSTSSLTVTSGTGPLLTPNARTQHRHDLHSPVNLGNPSEFTVNELVELVRKCVHEVTSTQNETPIEHLAMPKDDPKQRKPDITRATALLDWQPKWKLEQGLKEMTKYYWQRIQEGSL